MIAEKINQLAKNLVDNGVKYSFGVVGGGMSIQLVTALENLGVPFYPVAHEATAVYLAGSCSDDGKARGVAIGIKGPGFINFMPALLSNFYENLPSISISEAFNESVPSFKKHKRLNQESLCSEVTKAYGYGDLDADEVKKLIQIAESESPGPVHIDLCTGKSKVVTFYHPQIQSNDKGDEFYEAISKSKKPTVVFGTVAARIAFEKDLNVPFCSTSSAKGCVDENSDYWAGVVSGEVGETMPETNILQESDLIIGIGLRNTELVNPAFDRKAPLIILDNIEEDLHEGFSSDLVYYSSNLAHELSKISTALKEKSWGAESIAANNSKIDAWVDQFVWSPASVFKALQKKVKENVLCMDTGLFCIVGETLWKAKNNNEIRINGSSKFMGTSIPYAIGKAIANPDKTVLSISGDGGIRPYLPEIKLAISHKLDIIFFLFADGKYGTVARGVGTKKLSDNALDIENESWYQAIRQMGCESEQTGSLAELEKALEKRISGKGPLFIECTFDPQEYADVTIKLR